MSHFIDDSHDHSGSISLRCSSDIIVMHRYRPGAFFYIAVFKTDR
jgi:hypothetical protein